MQECLERNEKLKMTGIIINTVSQVLNRNLKKRQKHPDFRKNEAYAYFTDILRMSYGGLTVSLRFYTDQSNVKIQTKNDTVLITITGPSGAGKETVGRRLSEMVGYKVLGSYTTRP